MNRVRMTLSFCACCLCATVLNTASADPIGLVVVDATDAGAQSLGLSVCLVRVQFSQPWDNLLWAGMSTVSTNDPAGFYQHPQGSDTAPLLALLGSYPELSYDSFVTIGVAVDDGTNTTTRDPDWDSYAFNNSGQTAGGWYNINPLNDQGHLDENRQVFIAQFTVDEGYWVYGDLSVAFDEGYVIRTYCIQCYFCDTCPGDLDCDGQVGVSDQTLLLDAWGPNPCHPADLDGNGEVRVPDLTILLSNWGACVPCIPGDTGFLSPSAEAFDTGGDGDGFELNPTNAFADDAAFASNIDGRSDRHRYYNYDFSILPSCAVSGIEVRLDWWLDSLSGNNSLRVELSWDGGTSWTAAKIDGQETTTEHVVILGGSGDDWGRTWLPADFDDANFRVRVTSEGNNQRDWFLDWVAVKVTYAAP